MSNFTGARTERNLDELDVIQRVQEGQSHDDRSDQLPLALPQFEPEPPEPFWNQEPDLPTGLDIWEPAQAGQAPQALEVRMVSPTDKSLRSAGVRNMDAADSRLQSGGGQREDEFPTILFDEGIPALGIVVTPSAPGSSSRTPSFAGADDMPNTTTMSLLDSSASASTPKRLVRRKVKSNADTKVKSNGETRWRHRGGPQS